MTKHYQAHADREMKEKFLSQLPEFIGSPDDATSAGTEDTFSTFGEEASGLRAQLIALIRNLPEDELAIAERLLAPMIRSTTPTRLIG